MSNTVILVVRPSNSRSYVVSFAAGVLVCFSTEISCCELSIGTLRRKWYEGEPRGGELCVTFNVHLRTPAPAENEIPANDRSSSASSNSLSSNRKDNPSSVVSN